MIGIRKGNLQNPTSFVVKVLENLMIQSLYHNIIKAIHKSTGNIMLKRGKQSILTKIRNKTMMFTLSTHSI